MPNPHAKPPCQTPMRRMTTCIPLVRIAHTVQYIDTLMMNPSNSTMQYLLHTLHPVQDPTNPSLRQPCRFENVSSLATSRSVVSGHAISMDEDGD